MRRLIMGAALAVQAAWGAEAGFPGEESLGGELAWLKEETQVVSASRVAESLKKTAASVTVIDEEQIRAMGAVELIDVLRTVPGLGVTRSRVFWNEIESRGVKTWFSEKVLFMLDGHSLDNNLLNGGSTTVYDRLELDNVKRIEVVRGPASALYGANAFVALVHVITKDGHEVDGFQTRLRGGDYGDAGYSLLYGKKHGKLDLAAMVNGSATAGDRPYIQDAVGATGSPRNWRRRQDVSLKAGYGEWNFRGHYTRRKDGPNYGVLHSLVDETETTQTNWFAEAGYKTALDNGLELEVRGYHDFCLFENFWEFSEEGFLLDAAASDTKTGAELLGKYRLNASNFLVTGFMFERHKQFDVKNVANYNPTNYDAHLDTMVDYGDPDHNWGVDVERELWAVYGENLYDLNEKTRLTIGARYDHYSDLGGILNPRLGMTYLASDTLNFKLSYGQGFRAPTFAELYNTNNPIINGNPDLKPEKVKTLEGGAGIDLDDRSRLNLTLFNNEITDLVVHEGNSHANKGEMDTHGLEAEYKRSFRRGSYLSANLTWQEAKNEGESGFAAEVPRFKGTLAGNVRLSSMFSLYTDWFLKGATPRGEGDARDDVPAYGVVNTTLTARNFGGKLEALELRASVYNLMDQPYGDPSPAPSSSLALMAGDYPRAGRNWMAELSYKF